MLCTDMVLKRVLKEKLGSKKALCENMMLVYVASSCRVITILLWSSVIDLVVGLRRLESPSFFFYISSTYSVYRVLKDSDSDA